MKSLNLVENGVRKRFSEHEIFLFHLRQKVAFEKGNSQLGRHVFDR